jgi:hypothetical protein
LGKFQSEGSRLLERRGGADGEKVVDLADGLRGIRRGDSPAYAPTGDAIGLGHAVDDDGAIAHAVDARHGDVLGAVVEDMFVDFVGDAVGIPSYAKIANEFEFGASENFAGGIVRRVEDDGFCVRAERSAQFPFVEGPIGRPKFDEARSGAGKDCVRAVVFVEGFEDNDFVAGIDDGHHGRHHGFGRTAADGEFALGIDGDTLGASKFVDDGVAQGLGAPGDGVLIDIVGDSLACCFFNFHGSGEIGKALGEIDGVVLEGEAGHFADDGFGELFGFGGQHAAGDLGHVGFGYGHREMIVAKSRIGEARKANRLELVSEEQQEKCFLLAKARIFLALNVGPFEAQDELKLRPAPLTGIYAMSWLLDFPRSG